MASDHYLCIIFCFDVHSIRGILLPRTSPSGDNLGVQDYHVNAKV